ncbi:MAG TPA: PH domain-containing protein, partial [Anaerolineales bacterium]|nr:PH domain-containing protein [Anaerolineales bacterium]
MTTPNQGGLTTGLFPPSKRVGLVIHGVVIAVLAIISGWAFWRMSSAPVGLEFVGFILLGIVAFAPLPLLAYHAYALYLAQYTLDRDTLELRWGLRRELIPLADIEWVRPVADLTNPLVPPGLPLPGAVLGLKRHPDLGVVEFLSSQSRAMLLVGTPRRVYAISPARPQQFLDTFARAVELGSLRETDAESLYPSFVFAHAWSSGLVRYLWLATLFLNLGLTAWISLLIPTSTQFALGYQPDRSPDLVPSVQLIIIPLLSSALSSVAWLTGLFMYRRDERQPLALVLWVGAAVSSLLFLLAVLFIVV